MRQKLVAGNWKMNGSFDLLKSLLEPVSQEKGLSCQLLVCPPFPYLAAAADLLKSSGVFLGAQDCAATPVGAYTGEVAAEMLAEMGVSHVILGHSERRHYQAEGDALVLAKVKQALAAGLKPVVCVGETLEEKQAGQTAEVVLRQVQAVATQLSSEQLGQLIFAYEPVWAIGSGLTATPDQAQEVHSLIRKALAEQDQQQAARIQLLYGGSVKAENAASLFAMPDIDGGLIGGASLNASQFLAIGHAAS
ncbi:triosephosphate isomerase [Marinospirillum celere]|uniref:Triosephosphate isomerase n=1 Tax=Marinospirillum celere TaxID=1122252 RepID=A0A1I1IKT2_9GAMM|nr:triose-phosphate isomerase [Marinospirillum celere]SFC33830.1 triosephosphate isomerase [Marinospirillum celere]